MYMCVRGGGRGGRGECGCVGGCDYVNVCDCVGGCGCDCVGEEGRVWVEQP